jgi:hypothetical protein
MLDGLIDEIAISGCFCLCLCCFGNGIDNYLVLFDLLIVRIFWLLNEDVEIERSV